MCEATMASSKKSLSVQAWEAIQQLEDGLVWSVEDLIRRNPGLAADCTHPARSLAKAMTHLLVYRRIEKAGTHRNYDSSSWVLTYRRLPREEWLEVPPHPYGKAALDHEPRKAITRTKMKDGVTRVRFGEGWKPAHRESDERALRGWQCPLNSVFF